MSRPSRILVALGEDDTARAVSILVAAGHDAHAGVADASWPRQVFGCRPDLVVMDVPGDDPLALTTEVRRTHAASRPLLLCTVDGPEQWVPALEAGADAYLQKPYRARELELSVRAILRRAPWLRSKVHQVDMLLIDERSHLVLADGDRVELGNKAFGILVMLARHPGQVVSKRVLLEELWGYEAYDENLVEAQVCALRRQLPATARGLVRTVRGVGYVLRQDGAKGLPA